LSIASQHLLPSHLVSIRVFDVEPAYQRAVDINALRALAPPPPVPAPPFPGPSPAPRPPLERRHSRRSGTGERHIQAAADYVSDVSKRHALFGDPVIPAPAEPFSSASL
jgi:hypothetical protein